MAEHSTFYTKRGFTLVELLVVIGIISVLIGLLMPAVQMAREAARNVQCRNQMRQLGLAALNYENAKKAFPTGYDNRPTTSKPKSTWLVSLLPYLEQQAIYDQSNAAYNVSKNPFSNPPHTGFSQVMPQFVCPSNPNGLLLGYFPGYSGAAMTTYLGVNGNDWSLRDGILFDNSKTRLSEIRDGLSNTLLIGERPPSSDRWFGWWYTGEGQNGTSSLDSLMGVRETNLGTRNNSICDAGPYHFQAGDEFQQCDSLHFYSLHPGGANFCLADGSVAFTSYEADSILPAMATRFGKETFDRP